MELLEEFKREVVCTEYEQHEKIIVLCAGMLSCLLCHQREKIIFQRRIATNNKYTINKLDKKHIRKKIQKMRDYEMSNFIKIFDRTVEKIEFLADSYSKQNKNYEEDLVDRGFEVLEYLFPIKSQN